LAYADVETSSADYARRFAGPVGEWFLAVQTRLTLELLAGFRGASLLDVGGGHAQLAAPLAEAGFDVTVLGSDDACAERLRPLLDAGRVRFRSGDLLRSPFADNSFDVAVAYRLLPHVDDWRALLAELCRVARRAVLVDYPTRRSLNAFSDALFGFKKRVEGDTRPFRVFGEAELRQAFESAGFALTARRPEFFWPMALHRGLRAAAASRGLESLASASGLTAGFGSPVIVRAEPRD
jgi:2-polyprenyl-3-methyl-5-hydroxy-6-metoxy-1,4-benzoquinol methylase